MSTEQEGGYQVGYKKPPPQHRFVKGRSGNPNGCPKKPKTLNTFLDQALKETVVVNENGRRKTITKLEALSANQCRFILELLACRRHNATFNFSTGQESFDLDQMSGFVHAVGCFAGLRHCIENRLRISITS